MEEIHKNMYENDTTSLPPFLAYSIKGEAKVRMIFFWYFNVLFLNLFLINTFLWIRNCLLFLSTWNFKNSHASKYTSIISNSKSDSKNIPWNRLKWVDKYFNKYFKSIFPKNLHSASVLNVIFAKLWICGRLVKVVELKEFDSSSLRPSGGEIF